MTNIIKAPITRIRRKGPVVFEEVRDLLLKRAPFPRAEENDWAIVTGFFELDVLNTLCSDQEQEYQYSYGVVFFNEVDGELKFFALRKLMPELECW